MPSPTHPRLDQTLRLLALVTCTYLLTLSLTLAAPTSPTALASPHAPAPAALPTGQPRLLAAGPVFDALLSPNGQRVVYTKLASQTEQGANLSQLFSIPFVGGAATPLLANPAPQTGLIDQFVLSTDGERVISIVRPTVDAQAELYSVPIVGGSVTRLNGTLASGSSVKFALPIPNSNLLLFQSGPSTSGGSSPSELFITPVTGGTPRRVHEPLTGTQSVESWRLSADGSRIVYTIKDSSMSTPQVRLEAAPTAGGDPAPLATYPEGKGFGFEVSPNGAIVLYGLVVERQPQVTSFDLFKVAATGGSAEAITPATGGMFSLNFTISPDGAYAIVYIGGDGNPDLQDLYSVPLGGGTPVKLDPFLSGAEQIAEFKVSPDSTRVVFRALDSSFLSSLYSVPITGGTPAVFSPQSPSGQGIAGTFFITPNSERLIFFEGRQYRSAPIADSTSPIIIADELSSSAGAAYATNHFITGDSAHLFLRGQIIGESRLPLFAVTVASAGALNTLSGDVAAVAGPPQATGGSVIGFRANSAGTQLIFRGSAAAGLATALYAVGAGPTPPPPVKDKFLHLPLVRR